MIAQAVHMSNKALIALQSMCSRQDMLPYKSELRIGRHQRELIAYQLAIQGYFVQSIYRNHHIHIVIRNTRRLESGKGQVVHLLFHRRDPDHRRVTEFLIITLHRTGDIQIDTCRLRGFEETGALRPHQLELVGLARLNGGNSCAILADDRIGPQCGDTHHIEILAFGGSQCKRTAPIFHPYRLLYQVVGIRVGGRHHGTHIAVEDRHPLAVTSFDDTARQIAHSTAKTGDSQIGLSLLQGNHVCLTRRMATHQCLRRCDFHLGVILRGHNHKLRIHGGHVSLHHIFIVQSIDRQHHRHIKTVVVIVGRIHRNGVGRFHQDTEIAHRIRIHRISLFQWNVHRGHTMRTHRERHRP